MLFYLVVKIGSCEFTGSINSDVNFMRRIFNVDGKHAADSNDAPTS